MRDDCDRPPRRRGMTVLWALRIFGPAGSREIADRTGLSRRVVMDELARLIGYGQASNTDPAGYDVTDAGRRLLDPSHHGEEFRWVS